MTLLLQKGCFKAFFLQMQPPGSFSLILIRQRKLGEISLWLNGFLYKQVPKLLVNEY